MPAAHMLFGSLGSGKTTLARRLEQQHRAVRFTHDEWMARLFGENPPVGMFQEKAAAIFEIMEPLWTRCLALGVDVVLDFGFWSRAERDRTRALVRKFNAEPILYRLDCDDEEAWRRIDARNAAMDRTLYIAPGTYDVLKARVEPLGADEAFITADLP